MGLISRSAYRAFSAEGPYPLTSSRLIDLIGGGATSKSGARVTPETVLGLSSAWSCVNILAGAYASTPLQVFERLPDGGRQIARGHPTYRLLHDDPNPWMTSFKLRQTMMGHMALRGNAYAEIERHPRTAEPVALWPLRPDHMEQITVSAAGTLIYNYRLPNGEGKSLPQRNILHLRSLSSDGITGYSPVTVQRESFGLGLSVRDFGGLFFDNNARPGAILKTSGKLSTEAAERLSHTFSAAHSGLSNAHRLAVLENGVDYQSIGMTQADAQFLLTMNFSVRDTARIFNIPPHMIGDLEQATFSMLQIQGIEFTTRTMLPWFSDSEEQFTKDLLLPSERERYFVEFNMDGLTRGDIAAQTDSYGKGRQWGWFNVDEIRAKMNMNPLPNGEGTRYLEPVNMRGAGEEPVANIPEAAPA